MGQFRLQWELCGFWDGGLGIATCAILYRRKQMLRGIMQLAVFACVRARVCACVLTRRAEWQKREGLSATHTASKATSMTLAMNLNSLSNKHLLKIAQAAFLCPCYSTSISYSSYAGRGHACPAIFTVIYKIKIGLETTWVSKIHWGLTV